MPVPQNCGGRAARSKNLSWKPRPNHGTFPSERERCGSGADIEGLFSKEVGGTRRVEGVFDFCEACTDGVDHGTANAFGHSAPGFQHTGGARSALSQQILDAVFGGAPPVTESVAEPGCRSALRCRGDISRQRLLGGDHGRIDPRLDLIRRNTVVGQHLPSSYFEALDVLGV
ncbi:hypothetical protein A5772_13440 [Mycolicibacter sinensis]|uniref:Uncharacterized protein n=1 Tax=Mycolicibacter sinensis (strain JDM601) TaxID=875328 RepID=A0A1A2E140_MYCSD|nr:hypothetical protein A5772_13440 [Mycolicibacter sinensis]OBG00888.1 hypothetical protein A5771_17605 [Mycolicibacter sinensis]